MPEQTLRVSEGAYRHRVRDQMELTGLELEVTEAAPNHSTVSRTLDPIGPRDRTGRLSWAASVEMPFP